MVTITSPKILNLALQGGGSHGAYTWGVLDRLLEEDNLTIEGISGTSAGAMNAAALLEGHCKGGNQGAKDALEKFWLGVADLSTFGFGDSSSFQKMFGGFSFNVDYSPAAALTDAWTRMFSPYQTNPFNYNPLRDLLSKMIDIDAIRACKAIKVFICATNVENGRTKIFSRDELTVDALMASACLPFTFQAVMIDGVPYWDGGYSGNPAIFPLIYGCESPDVAIVQINPLTRKGIPENPTDILNRLNEISFNASLISEMRAIAFVERLVEEDHLKSTEAARLKKMNMHVIGAEDELSKLGASSKSNTSRDFLLQLKAIGRHAADQWLTANWQNIGEQSSVDVRQMFLD